MPSCSVPALTACLPLAFQCVRNAATWMIILTHITSHASCVDFPCSLHYSQQPLSVHRWLRQTSVPTLVSSPTNSFYLFQPLPPCILWKTKCPFFQISVRLVSSLPLPLYSHFTFSMWHPRTPSLKLNSQHFWSSWLHLFFTWQSSLSLYFYNIYKYE